jgi:hypothetical protein
MSLRYLLERTQAMLQSIELAHKEAQHLRYSQSTLFGLSIDLQWVENLGNQPVLAEKVEAFVSRFGRLQDHLGEKLLPRYATLVVKQSKPKLIRWHLPSVRACWPALMHLLQLGDYAMHWCMNTCKMRSCI